MATKEKKATQTEVKSPQVQEVSSVDKFTQDMKRPIRVKVKNLESNLPVYVSWHFDANDRPGFKAINADEVVTLPLGKVLDLMVNQTIYNERLAYSMEGNYIGKQGANHTKYSIQLLDPIEDKYLDYVERRTIRKHITEPA